MRYAYWLLVGALLGFGLMAVFSIGIPLFLLGLVLALYRVWRAGGRGFGLVLVGMGLLPALYLSIRYFARAPTSSTRMACGRGCWCTCCSPRQGLCGSSWKPAVPSARYMTGCK